MTENQPTFQIGMSNLNLAPRDLFHADPAWYVDALERGGYNPEIGYEWSTMRIGSMQRIGDELAAEGYISAVQQSWRENRLRDVLGALRTGGAASQMQTLVAFPLLDKSYRDLRILCGRAGKYLPLITHPLGQWLDNQPESRPRTGYRSWGGEVWIQPTVEWAESQNIETNSEDSSAISEQIEQAMQVQGLTGIALDLHHLGSERAGRRFKNPVALAASLATSATFREVQVSLRPDFGGDERDFRTALTGNLAQTEIGDMLHAVVDAYDFHQPLRVIVEVAAAAIQASGHKDYLAAHAQLTADIGSIISSRSA